MGVGGVEGVVVAAKALLSRLELRGSMGPVLYQPKPGGGMRQGQPTGARECTCSNGD